MCFPMACWCNTVQILFFCAVEEERVALVKSRGAWKDFTYPQMFNLLSATEVEIFGTCCMYKICIHIIYIILRTPIVKFEMSLPSIYHKLTSKRVIEWFGSRMMLSFPIFSNILITPYQVLWMTQLISMFCGEKNSTNRKSWSKLKSPPDDLLPIHRNGRNWLFDARSSRLPTDFRLSWAMLRSKNATPTIPWKKPVGDQKKVVFRMGCFIKIHQNIFWYLIFDIDIKVVTKTHLGQISTCMTCDIQPPKSKVQKQLLGTKNGEKVEPPIPRGEWVHTDHAKKHGKIRRFWG